MDRFREDDSIQVFLSTDAGGVGLNLQSGSVLVNLDVPWNPAVLEQRNGRIHRLGQTRKVQIITMVASQSYEEHVLSLVKNKQNLFDNVISEDATENVVGVSKKLLETLMETLPAKKADDETEQDKNSKHVRQTTADQPLEDYEYENRAGDESKPDNAVEEYITRCIEALQNAFGSRIERIMGSGGGLLAVLDKVDEEADQIATQLSSQIVPVAIIDLLTLNGLSRLGTASPIETSQTYYDASQDTDDTINSRLMALAKEKLTAAQVLVEQNIISPALEILLSAQLAAAADQSGQETPPSPQEAGIWLYGEALPKGLLSQQKAELISKTISLCQCQSVPENILKDLQRDTEIFIGALAETAGA